MIQPAPKGKKYVGSPQNLGTDTLVSRTIMLVWGVLLDRRPTLVHQFLTKTFIPFLCPFLHFVICYHFILLMPATRSAAALASEATTANATAIMDYQKLSCCAIIFCPGRTH
jgi:hypothetical protein